MAVIPMERPQCKCRCCNRVVFCECERGKPPEYEVVVAMTENQREVLKDLSRHALMSGKKEMTITFEWCEKKELERLLVNLSAAPLRRKRV